MVEGDEIRSGFRPIRHEDCHRITLKIGKAAPYSEPEAVRRVATEHRALIANVDVAVAITHELDLRPLSTPNRAGLLAEKLAAHVIVDADDVQPPGGKKPSGLGPDQTHRASDYGNSHSPCPLTLLSLPLTAVLA